jgi:hypothetical protein
MCFSEEGATVKLGFAVIGLDEGDFIYFLL